MQPRVSYFEETRPWPAECVKAFGGFGRSIFLWTLVQMGYGYGHTDIRSFSFSLYAALELRSGTSGYLQAAFAQSTCLVANTETGGQDSLIRSG
jgi:hypothetical protein